MVRTMVLASTMLAMLGAATSGIAQPAPALPLVPRHSEFDRLRMARLQLG